MFKRGGTPNTGIMDGFGEDRVMAQAGLYTGQMPQGFMAAEDEVVPTTTTPQPTTSFDDFQRREAPDEPVLGLSDYASLFKLGANIASAPGRGDGLGGFLAAAGPSLSQAADEFAASQEAKAARRREFEKAEDAREDAFKEARRGEEFQTGLLREEFDLKTALEKLKIELDPPDAVVRLRQAQPLQAALANAKTKREQIFADANATPKEKRDILLEIRNLQNQIAGVMGQAVDVGELEREDRRRINNFAEDEALVLLGLDEPPTSGQELREYNQLVEEIRQYKIVEELIILTQGATFAEGGRVGFSDGGRGDLKFAVERFIRDFPEFENLEGKELYKEMEKRGYLSDRDEMQQGGRATGSGPMLTFEELRARLPMEVTDQVVRLIATSEAALLDFANIDTQEDIAVFNQKYNVDLQLPTQAV